MPPRCKNPADSTHLNRVEMDEKQASERAGDGGEPACLSPPMFAAELTKSYPRLWLLAVAITRDHAEAEDVVQEATLIALRKLSQFEMGTNFHAWMSKIVRLQAYNVARKRVTRQTVAVDPATIDRTHQPLAGTAGRTEPVVDGRGRLASHQTQFDDEVVRALDDITDTARACLLLRVCHGLPYADIAAMLEIPPGTAMSHVHRAKATIRGTLRRRGVRR